MIWFVESIPGGGKSTRARKLLKQCGGEALYYKEEYYNPVDLLRQAVLTPEQYRKLLRDLENLSRDGREAGEIPDSGEPGEITEALQRAVTYLDGRVFVPYLHLPGDPKIQKRLRALWDLEVCDGKTDAASYCELVIRRLEAFLEGRPRRQNCIFEGALLHNPLMTILGWYQMTEEEILGVYGRICSLLEQEDYRVCLVRPDNVSAVIQETAARRKLADPAWQQGFEEWLAHAPNYRGLQGTEGIVRVAEDLACWEERILRELPFQKEIIERKVE